MQPIETINKGYFLTISEFKLMKQIGVGSFGKVKLALHIPTKKQYAIKIIDLSDNFTNVEIKLIEREIKAHMYLDHPHIIKLWDTFQQKNNVYMIMEFATNGSLFRYHSNLLKQGINPTIQQVHKFFSQTLSAVKYMHLQDYMHRDIKPENILLDDNLNIKVCDFGWVTNQISTLRNTFCGTYQYMAPQMLLEKSYNYKIDIWALGVLIYELIHGQAPFPGQNLDEVKERIHKGQYQISNKIPLALKNLIADVLQFTPQKRLGLVDIEKHMWMQAQCKIENFKQQEIIPKLKNNRSSDYISKKQQESFERDKKKIFCTFSKTSNHKFNESLERTKHIKQCAPLFNALLTQTKQTLKIGHQQKRIKKKCKTQGEQQFAIYENYVNQQNLFPRRNSELGDEDQTLRIKKQNNFLNAKEIKFSKDLKENKKLIGIDSHTKIKKKKKHTEKYVKKIDQKLNELSHKFMQQKIKESKLMNFV